MTRASFDVGTLNFAILGKTAIIPEKPSRPLISAFWATRNHRVCRMTRAGAGLS